MISSFTFMPQGTSAFRVLWLVVLCAVALVQIAALAMVAQSQVQKAQLRALVERSVPWEAGHCPRPEYAPTASAACRLREASANPTDQVLTASYSPTR